MAQVDYKKLYEDLKKSNEKMSKLEDKLGLEKYKELCTFKRYLKKSQEKVTFLDCENEKLKKENEKLKERQMIMNAIADSHIQDINEIHKDYGDMIREKDKENEFIKTKVIGLTKKCVELQEENQKLDFITDTNSNEIDTLNNIIKSLTISVIITNNEEYQDEIELENKRSVMSCMNAVQKSTYTDIIKKMNEMDWNEDGNMCKIIYDEEEATLSFEVQDEDQ